MARVKMPDGQVVELPDNPTPQQMAEIEAAMSTPPSEPSGKQVAARRLGLLARIPYEAATGTVGAVGDFGAGVAGLATGKYTPSPIGSDAIRKLLNRFMPEPQGFEENAVDVIGQMAAGKLDAPGRALVGAVSKIAPVAKNLVTPVDQLQKEAQHLYKQGYKLLPNEGEGGLLGKTLTGLGGKEKVAQALQNQNQEVSNALAKKAGSVSPNLPLTMDSLIGAEKQIIAEGYDPVRRVSGIAIGSDYRNKMVGIIQKYQSPDFPADTKQNIVDRVARLVYDNKGRPLKSYSGSGAMDKISELRSDAADQFKQGGDSQYGRALREMAQALEDNIELHLNSALKPGSKVLEDFRKARVDLAKNYTVRKLLSDHQTGTVDPTKARARQMSGKLMTGELDTLARAGAPSFAQSTKAPTAQPSLYSPWEWSLMTTGAATGMASGNVPALLGAGGIAARPLYRAAAASNPLQSMMFGEPTRLFDPATKKLLELQALRMGATPFFSQGQE